MGATVLPPRCSEAMHGPEQCQSSSGLSTTEHASFAVVNLRLTTRQKRGFAKAAHMFAATTHNAYGWLTV